ncbi:MAG TPA: hypothetical protein VKU80_06235 [Planctomycetota bacterium]|nr:hypothetical protein [Planctomycetota bacterium]
MRVEADPAKRASRDFMTADGKRVITAESGGAAGAPQAGAMSLPDTTKGLSDDQVNAQFVATRLSIALEHYKAGRLSVAKGILEDIVVSYPKAPEAKSAKELLDAINEKK